MTNPTHSLEDGIFLCFHIVVTRPSLVMCIVKFSISCAQLLKY
jgi:hypothetical protein